MFFSRIKMLRIAVLALILTAAGRLFLYIGATTMGRFLYSDPATLLLYVFGFAHIHLPSHILVVILFIWVTIFWIAFSWFIGAAVRK